jgi:hypothetical protein
MRIAFAAFPAFRKTVAASAAEVDGLVIEGILEDDDEFSGRHVIHLRVGHLHRLGLSRVRGESC